MMQKFDLNNECRFKCTESGKVFTWVPEKGCMKWSFDGGGYSPGYSPDIINRLVDRGLWSYVPEDDA